MKISFPFFKKTTNVDKLRTRQNKYSTTSFIIVTYSDEVFSESKHTHFKLEMEGLLSRKIISVLLVPLQDVLQSS